MVLVSQIYKLMFIMTLIAVPIQTQLHKDSSQLTSLLEVTSMLSGDILSKTFDALSAIPLGIARDLEENKIKFPVISNEFNTPEVVDNFIAQFHIGEKNEDRILNISELIRKNNYPVEEHLVNTEDGYILTMFRIPSNGPAVFLMHGLLESADDWIINGPESGLAYLLSNNGFDVWMGNARGNKHSRKHVKLLPNLAEFWNFSWHEIGVYDIPAMIDYALNITDQKQVKYVAHSQGVTSYFVMTSEKPQYVDKINVMVALAPAVFVQGLTGILRLASAGVREIDFFHKLFGLYELLPDNNLLRTVKSLLCGSGPTASIFCNNLLFLIGGINYQQTNVTNLPVIFSHFPSGASTKQLIHYGQLILSKLFRQYDLGNDKNMAVYGSEEPPEYNLKISSAPVALFYSEGDWLVSEDGVTELRNQLPNVIDFYKVPLEVFTHFDFMYAKDVNVLVYERVMNILLSSEIN